MLREGGRGYTVRVMRLGMLTKRHNTRRTHDTEPRSRHENIIMAWKQCGESDAVRSHTGLAAAGTCVRKRSQGSGGHFGGSDVGGKRNGGDRVGLGLYTHAHTRVPFPSPSLLLPTTCPRLHLLRCDLLPASRVLFSYRALPLAGRPPLHPQLSLLPADTSRHNVAPAWLPQT